MLLGKCDQRFLLLSYLLFTSQKPRLPFTQLHIDYEGMILLSKLRTTHLIFAGLFVQREHVHMYSCKNFLLCHYLHIQFRNCYLNYVSFSAAQSIVNIYTDRLTHLSFILIFIVQIILSQLIIMNKCKSLTALQKNSKKPKKPFKAMCLHNRQFKVAESFLSTIR